ncbi:MAG TPA: glycosyltransferase family 39 protein [Acidimicrobiales bacterium]|jgi:4-amino-4-deoxy-L-arabinose transferase-like glycosyltransferase
MSATATLAAPAADPPAPPEVVRPLRRERLGGLVLAALLVGLAVRVAVGLTDDAASTDETAYLHSGLSFVHGDGFERYGQPELHFPPFLPVLLGVASGVVADPHTGTVALTVVSGTLLILPLSLLGRRLAGPPGGVVTAWVAALAPGLATMPQIRGTGSEAEYALLVVSALWLVVSAADREGRARLLRLAAAGLLVGLAYLTRPEGLFMVLPLGVAVVVLARRGPPRVVATVAAFAVPVLLCVVPYAAYLHANTGRWELTAKTQDASIEAWAAVARGDRATRNGDLYGLDGSGLRFSARYTPLTTLAREHPGEYRGIVATNIGKLRDVVKMPSVLPLPLWALAAFGAWRFRRSRTVWLLLAVGALPVLSALAFFVQQRYLVVTIALATVLVGAALGSLGGRLRHVATAVTLGLAVFATVVSFRGDVAGWWHPVEQTEQRAAGEWLAAHSEPGARVMTRSMIVEFYAERPSVAMPAAGLDEVLTFARHYGVDYLVADWYTVDRLMPELGVLMEDGDVPGLRLVHEVRAEGREARIFALDPPAPDSSAPPPPLGFTGDGG